MDASAGGANRHPYRRALTAREVVQALCPRSDIYESHGHCANRFVFTGYLRIAVASGPRDTLGVRNNAPASGDKRWGIMAL
jgi:hypothetical protein